MRDLPDPIADYKGITRYRTELLAWLRTYEDDEDDEDVAAT